MFAIQWLCILAKISNIPMQKEYHIRPVQLQDNKPLAHVLREVLVEFGVPKVGTAYADPELDDMFHTYTKKRHSYWVVHKDNSVLGGAGIAPLRDGPANICELQKMYFAPEARHVGMGKRMLLQLLKIAIEFGFELCYLETMPNMHAAQKLYTAAGFGYVDAPIGNTGHYSCPVWMTKSLV